MTARSDARAPDVASATARSRGVLVRPGAVLAPLLAVLALGAAATTVPDLVRGIVDPPPEQYGKWSRPELYPLRIGISPEVVVRAEQVLPEDALYAVVVGDQMMVEAEGIGIHQALHYFLLPRRFTDVTEAEWVLTWGHSAETLGVPVEREIGLVDGVNVVKVRR